MKLDWHNARFWLATLLLLVAYVFGGRTTPVTQLIYGSATGLALLAWLWLPGRAGGRMDWLVMACGLVVLLVHLVQLIPLPPAIWHALPGRGVELDALNLIGAGNDYMPISLAPFKTQQALLAILTPVVLLYMTLMLSEEERTRMLAVIVALGLLTVLVGALQLAGGQANFARFYEYNYDSPYLTGFNENRNTTAELLNYSALALVALCRVLGRRLTPRRQIVILVGGVMTFVLAVVLTGSRSGVLAAILPMVLMLTVFRWPPIRMTGRSVAIGGGALVLCVVVLVALAANPRVLQTSERFSTIGEDLRWQIHQDTRFAIGQYWPVGAGMDSFRAVFPLAERLEYVQPKIVNRAHSDYLELMLEAGIPGLIALAAIAGIVAFRIGANLVLPGSRVRKSHSFFALAVVCILALHSLVDYPVRTIATASIVAVAVGLLGRVRASAVDAAKLDTGN